MGVNCTLDLDYRLKVWPCGLLHPHRALSLRQQSFLSQYGRLTSDVTLQFRRSEQEGRRNTCMYVGMYLFIYSENTLTFNALRHRQCKQSMCSEGQTGIKHLRLPKTYRTY